jgi:hypothetical protein
VYYKKEFGCHLKKRPTEFQVDKVLQPFEETKFNFTKVGKEEALFQLKLVMMVKSSSFQMLLLMLTILSWLHSMVCAMQETKMMLFFVEKTTNSVL